MSAHGKEGVNTYVLIGDREKIEKLRNLSIDGVGGAVTAAAVGVEDLLVAQLARRLDRLRHRARRRLHVEHVAHKVLRRCVHDECAVPEMYLTFYFRLLPPPLLLLMMAPISNLLLALFAQRDVTVEDCIIEISKMRANDVRLLDVATDSQKGKVANAALGDLVATNFGDGDRRRGDRHIHQNPTLLSHLADQSVDRLVQDFNTCNPSIFINFNTISVVK